MENIREEIGEEIKEEKKENEKKSGNKIGKRIGIGIAIFFGILLVAFLALWIHSKTYRIPEQKEKITNTTGLIQVADRSLYDANGDRIVLRGVNAGQILLQEGWMSPFAIEPLKNADGSYVKDEGDNIQYPDFAEEDFRQGIKDNPNLNSMDMEELMRMYWMSFFSEEDFRIIKEDLGLNVIRLPFYYLNLMNEDLTLKTEEEAFSYLDWFLGMAAKYELYVILDLHGAPGSQNGYEHSGASERVENFWDVEEHVEAVIEIWDFISKHYTNVRPDLGVWIASYDLLNEPTDGYKGVTTKKCWDVFDRIHDQIRENGDAHVITMEGCWDFNCLPDPKDYGWTNVQYEYHWYNWISDLVPYEIYYMKMDLFHIGEDYNVPILIGEFTLFEDKEAWENCLDLFDARNYSWTIWNYKTTVTGWWTSSWGVYTCQLKAVTEWEDTKCNISTCTFEEYKSTCEKTETKNCATGTLYEVLKEYKERNGH